MGERLKFSLQGDTIVASSGVRLDLPAAEALLASYDSLFQNGKPMAPWPSFLGPPRNTEKARSELRGLVADLRGEG